MEKSLQNILEDSEDKDLADKLRKIENSYIIKGLEWIDKKSNLKSYFPNSKLAKVFEFPRDLFLYGNIGMVPGEKQEKYAKKLGHDRFKFTKYSILLGLGIGCLKVGIAGLSATLISTGIGIWGLIIFADDLARTAYVLIKKKPIGSFIYTEWPYWLGKYLLRRKEKKKLAIESEDLNSTSILNLS